MFTSTSSSMATACQGSRRWRWASRWSAAAYPEVQDGIAAKVGYLPYYAIHGSIEDTLRAICDPDVQEEAAARGTQYINDHHAQDKVVDKLKRVYAEAMERYDPNEGPWGG